MSQRGRGRKVILVSLVPLTFVIVLILFFISYINRPAQGTLLASPRLTSTKSNNFNLTPVSVSGRNISFSYPASLVFVSDLSNSSSVLESYTYKYHDIESWLLAISVNRLPQANLSYDSNYSIRKQSPLHYAETTTTVGTKTFYVFQDLTATGFAKVAFILNGNVSADISLLGDDQLGVNNLVDTFNVVINTFNWK
jgi:hypothetical protein